MYSYANCFWEAKLYKYITEDNEDTSFSCDIGVFVPISLYWQRAEGLVYPLE